MNWNVSFDYCALFTLFIFGAYAFSMRQIKSRLNTIFITLNVFTAATVLFEILAVYTTSDIEFFGVRMAYFANVIYFILFDLNIFCFFIYLMVFTEGFKKGFTQHIILFVPTALNIILAALSPAFRFVIDVNENGYRHGFLYPVHVVIICGYMLAAFISVVRYRKHLSKTRSIALFMCFIMFAAANIVQTLLDSTLLLGLAMTYSIVSIYLSQYSTGDSIDRDTDAFNKKAFYLSTSSHIDDQHPFSVIAFEPDNFGLIADQYGEDKKNQLLRQIVDFLNEIVDQQAVFKLDGNKFAILLGKNDKYVKEETFIKYYYASHVFRGESMRDSEESRIVLQALSERFDHLWTVGEEHTRLSTCICYLRYPEDVSRADEVNDMIDAALRQAHAVGNGTILYAAEYTQTRETYISELQNKQAELEEATRAAEQARLQAERADDSKTRFLANMSHEIRTPMNAIMGMTELILRDDISDQNRKNVENIQSAGNTLLTIINDILDFSKIEAGKMELVNGTYETASLLNNVLSVSAARLSGKNLDMIVDVDPHIPSKFKGDEMRLRQVIINLMGNAIKYTESGSVTLRLGWEPLAPSPENINGKKANLVVSVIDTGSGIKEEDLNKLFKSFSRIEEEKNHLIEGTGLGLSIVKRLLDLMDGTVTVESEYGYGSDFTIKVPQEVEDKTEFAKIENKESKCVLIYSETAAVHNSLGAVLDSLGVSYTAALSPEELGQALEARQFTHLFVEYSRYGQVWDLVKELKDMKIVVLLRGNQMVDTSGGIRSIRHPFYTLNVAEALNDIKKKEEKKAKREYFKAPDAKVLIVDDNAINIQILAGLLKPHNMQVDSALSGKECLRLVKETEYDLILMDHMMPEMDGVETLNAIRELEGDYFKKVPVVVVTANAMSGVQEAMNEVGFQGYISKPINIDKLESTLLDFIPIEKIQNGSNADSGEIIALFVPGLNVHKGILNCGGKLKTYISTLNTLLIDGQKRLRQLEICVRDDDYKTYEREVHEICRNAVNIGADVLADMASVQETACQENRIADVKINHSRFCDTLRKLLTDVDDAIRDSKAKLTSEEHDLQFGFDDSQTINYLTIVHSLLTTGHKELAERVIRRLENISMSDGMRNIVLDLISHVELSEMEDARDYLGAKLEQIAGQKQS